MNIIPIESGPVATIGYLVIDESAKEGIIIDVPPQSKESFLSLIEKEQIKIVGIILTHTHWDHTVDCAALHRHTKAPVYVHKSDYFRLENPNENTIMPLWFDIEPVITENFIGQNDIIECGTLKFEVRHTPGHTEGSICLVEHSNKSVFSGDTLFYQSIGRTDLPGGDYDTIIDSISRQLMTLGNDYNVYCGHGELTTIGKERISNPFVNNKN